VRNGKVNELFVYDNFSRVNVEEVQAGDICALTGIADIGVSGWPWGGREGGGCEGGGGREAGWERRVVAGQGC